MKNKEALSNSIEIFDYELDSNSISEEELRNILMKIISDLIQSDYQKLVRILYRIDVDELKLKKALIESELSISETITDLIIERQNQKIITRNQFKNHFNHEKNIRCFMFFYLINFL